VWTGVLLHMPCLNAYSLCVSESGCKCEQKADQMSFRSISMPAPSLFRCSGCQSFPLRTRKLAHDFPSTCDASQKSKAEAEEKLIRDFEERRQFFVSFSLLRRCC
jgi:hypothetical protein